MTALPQTEYIHFSARRSRSEFVATRFAQYFEGSLLDVGCFEAPLRELLTDIDYTGVDFVGKPDLQVNLEQVQALPFEDGEFNTVICIEVLEHLNNLHQLFDDLARVSQRYVIVSLPNCWRDARVRIERGVGSFGHYGLPAERPKDRHKWFFSFQEAQDFLVARGERNGLRIVELFATEKPKNAPVMWLRKLRYPGMRYLNRYANTVWVVFEKTAL